MYKRGQHHICRLKYTCITKRTSLSSYSVTFSFWRRLPVSTVTQDTFVDSVKIVQM